MAYGLRTASTRVTGGKGAHEAGQYVDVDGGGGDPDLFIRGGMVGFSQTRKTTLSFWLGAPKDSGHDHELFWGYDSSRGDDTFRIEVVNYQIRIYYWRFPGSNQTYLTSTKLVNGGVWNHIMYATQQDSINSRQLWINGVEDISASYNTWTNYDFNWDDAERMELCKTMTNGANDDFALAQWLMHYDFIDLRTAANREKFIYSNKRYRHFGSDGSGPFGLQPPLYWEGWQQGNFLVHGGTMFPAFSGGGGTYMPKAVPVPQLGLSFGPAS